MGERVMDQMTDLQTKFSRALLDPAQPIPSAIRGTTRRKADRRFAVCRNNVVAGLIDALAGRFPVVRRLVGDAFFEGMASVYVVTCPPASPVMLLYGDSFPGFVKNFAPAANVPYLSDVARLEIARGRAYHAADAVPVEMRVFAALPSERLADLRIDFHPSVSIIKSSISDRVDLAGERRSRSCGADRALGGRSGAGRAAVWRRRGHSLGPRCCRVF